MKLPSTRLTDSAFSLTAAFYLIYLLLFLKFNAVYFSLDGEKGFTEILGALGLFATSFFLLKSAHELRLAKAPAHQFWLSLGAGIVFFWAAGEEISWGQHFLGHQTPQWLMEVNDQGETNLHNMNKKFFDRTLDRLITILTLVTAVFHWRGKERLWGLLLPDVPLCLSLILLPFYRRFDNPSLDIMPLALVALLLYGFMAFKRQSRYLALRLGVLLMVAGFLIFFHLEFVQLFGKSRNIQHEVRETAFALICTIYAASLWLDAKKRRL